MKRCKVDQRRTCIGVAGMPHLFVLLGVFHLACRVSAQLIINVQNQGGEIVQETITSSVGDDTCTLEFQRSDGTLVTKLIDFKSEVQVLKALVLGEEERGQSQYQVMCFVTKFQKGDFITADAMAKLRQKNPSTIRTPEEDRGKENYTMTGWVLLDRAAPISRHVAPLCAEAQESTYVRDTDLKAWAELPGSSISILGSVVKPFPTANTITEPSRCSEVSAIWAPCLCTLEMCIGWYPCGLKYCKGKPDSGGLQNGAAGSTSYRCGIKTCRKCHQYSYYVREKQQCLWDE
ncbi:out at first protein [Anopheles darlingi]|uniref:out at first protein n=1 Tax=Anopheles darlingi TaxID=43151 RepID=UPI0021002DD4|nr:out at first protein [Anopheles darlingi]